MEYKKELYHYIDNYQVNEPIFIEDIKEYFKDKIGEVLLNKKLPIIYVYISRLVRDGYLKSFSSGIYYKGNINLYQVIEKKYISDKNRVFGYITSDSLLYELGIKTLKPSVVTLVSNKCYKGTKYKNNTLGVIVRKPKIEVDNDNYIYLQLLDLIKQDVGKGVIYKYIKDNHLDWDKIFMYARLSNNMKLLGRL